VARCGPSCVTKALSVDGQYFDVDQRTWVDDGSRTIDLDQNYQDYRSVDEDEAYAAIQHLLRAAGRKPLSDRELADARRQRLKSAS
jgi:hypothetical protein